MTRPLPAGVSQRPITATMAGLVALFGMSESTLRRAMAAHGIQGSDRFGPIVYRVDDVHNAIFPLDAAEVPPAGSSFDPAVEAVKRHAQTKADRNGRAA